jgi:hypothetical protein
MNEKLDAKSILKNWNDYIENGKWDYLKEIKLQMLQNNTYPKTKASHAYSFDNLEEAHKINANSKRFSDKNFLSKVVNRLIAVGIIPEGTDLYWHKMISSPAYRRYKDVATEFEHYTGVKIDFEVRPQSLEIIIDDVGVKKLLNIIRMASRGQKYRHPRTISEFMDLSTNSAAPRLAKKSDKKSCKSIW